MFGGVALLTQHPHWQKSSDPPGKANGRTGFQKVAPITEPLTEWINSMEPSTIETLQKYLLPMSVLTGIIAVATPDIMVEMEFRKLKAQAQRQGMPMTPPRLQVVDGGAQPEPPTNGVGQVSITVPPEEL